MKDLAAAKLEKLNSAATSDAIPGRGLYTEEARNARLQFLKDRTGLSLESMRTTRLESADLRGNIENFIGGIEIPVGLAGPLLIKREGEADSVAYAPVATTEGALISSITRGAKAASLSGGIFAKAIRQRMTRAPMFEMKSISEAVRFSEHALSRFSDIQSLIKKRSNFSKLIEIEPVIIGRSVHLCFIYETGDAAGQNMTTICTMSVCTWLIDDIQQNCGIEVVEFVLEGNLSTDKKASHRSAIRGRGTQVIAECKIPHAVLLSTLKVTPEQMVKIYNRGISANVYAGMQAFNVNVANIVAGIFAATGQDIACTHESSIAQLHLEIDGGDLYASLTMPSLIVGTVGGGTRLSAQNEMLQLLGCEGAHQSARLAETICAFALALDLSTLAAMVGGQFASAHERLGRNKEQLWLKHEELNDQFFTEVLKPRFPDAHRFSARTIPMRAGDSLVIESASQVTKRLCGLFPFEVEISGPSGNMKIPVLLKVKPTDREVILATELMASLCNNELAHAYKAHAEVNPFIGCHLREMKIYEETDPRFTEIAPKFYGNIRDDRREVFILAMEYFAPTEEIPFLGHPSKWSEAHLHAAIDGIAAYHSLWLGKEAELQSKEWISSIPTPEALSRSTTFWTALAKHGRQEFSEWLSERDFEIHWQIIHSLKEDPQAWQALAKSPRTLIHNDFNPRNITFKRSDSNELKLCAYDWELATIHLPQRDLAELLSFTLDSNTTWDELQHYLTHHREKLEQASQVKFDAREWQQGFELCLKEFLITRLSMYFVAHTHRVCDFLPRTYRTTHHLLALLAAKKGRA